MKAVYLIATTIIALSACSTKQGKTEQVTTIDSTLQAKVTSILESKLEEFGAQSGQAIIMEVQTGQIKALVDKDFTTPYRSELVRCASLLTALETDKVHLSDTIDTGNGMCIIGNDTLYDHNWHRGGYGKLTVKQAFAHNSIIGNYKTMTKAFGDNMEECFNKVRHLYDAKSLIIFANHGEWAMITPLLSLALVNKIAANTGNDSLKSALRYTVTDGLGKPAHTEKVKIAGMAGTTQQEDGSYWAEFCGYFPADNPQYSMIVSIHKDNLPASGGAMAGSVFKEIVEYMNTANISKSANDIRFGDWKENDWLDNEYIRTLRKYLDDYNAGIVSNPELDPYKEQIKGKFVIYDITPYLVGGAFIRITFLDMPDRVFSSWVYSHVDEQTGIVESYEFRSISIEEEETDMTKEDILQAIKEMDGLKLW